MPTTDTAPHAVNTEGLTRLEAEAKQLIADVYAERGRGTLSCAWCAGHEVFVDGDALSSYGSVREVHDLIEHTRYAHTGAADIVFVAPVVVLKGTR